MEEMWECDWERIKRGLDNKKELEETARQQTLKPRDALVGGRTEAFKTYHKCEGRQQIHYRDGELIPDGECLGRLRDRLR